MEKLVAECELDCPDEKQVQVFEKCLALLRPDCDARGKSLAWLLLSKIVEKCSPQCLRAVQSRLGKKLADVKNDPSIYSGLFVRELLIRNPQVGNLHADLVQDIILRFIDMATRSSDSTIRKLCTELYAIRYGCDAQMSQRLLATLSAAISNRLLSQEERAVVLDLKSLGISSLRSDLCKLLFGIFSSALSRAKQGQYITCEPVMKILDEALNDTSLCDAALTTIQSICENGKHSALPIIPRMVLMLISKLDSNSSALYETLAHICSLYGPGSTLFRHFYEIFSSMKHPLDDQNYGSSAGRLLSAIIETSAFLIKPEVLISIQRKICEEILRKPESVVYRGVLISFLSCSHELVPAPVQVARTVIARCVDTTDLQTLRSLCDALTRPRIQDLAHNVVVRRRMAKVGQDCTSDGMDTEDIVLTTDTTNVENFAEFDKRVEEAIREVEQPKTGAEQVLESQAAPSTSFPTSKSDVTDSPQTTELPVEVEMVETESEPPVPTQEPVVKKAKVVRKKAKTQKQIETITLMEGEATVDEILSTFCPE
uniref:Serine/threonine-protein kinase TOR n=1 Tax=Haemonchus contortus TaxID=6289 RepID=A0A7I4XVS5_HAECO|nr:Hypothetical protein CBG11961 [Haemonchus contortus]